MSDAHSTTLWLDHFICSYDLHTRIVEMQILEKNPSSDHLPVYAKFTLDIGSTINNSSNVSVGDESIPFVKYQWAKASDSDIEEYRQGTYRKLVILWYLQLFIVRMLRVRIVNIDIILRNTMITCVMFYLA